MKKLFVFIIMSLIISSSAGVARAHVGMLIPADSMGMQNDNRTINVKLSFSHPFEGEGMELVEPVVFGVMANGKKADLLKTLRKTKLMGHTAWETSYTIKRPGVYMFYMEPKPYWEPAEDCYIVHYTKTVVTAFGDDEGWDQEIGLKTEIVPLSKPYGLYTGNVFQGIVKMDGKPVPFGEVEVEYYNKDRKAQAPTDYMVTQTIKADANGVFTYSAPKAGWWGFAALNTSDKKIKGKNVEIGAVLWVRFHDWK
jgi:cobalt/nickel transport protein